MTIDPDGGFNGISLVVATITWIWLFCLPQLVYSSDGIISSSTTSNSFARLECDNHQFDWYETEKLDAFPQLLDDECHLARPGTLPTLHLCRSAKDLDLKLLLSPTALLSPHVHGNDEEIDETYLPSKHDTKNLLKTGTTIVGCLASTLGPGHLPDVVILAADTRATEGTIVADGRCEKVHQLAANVWACGAGTSGDLDALTEEVRYSFLLRGRKEGRAGNYGAHAIRGLNGDEITASISSIVGFIVDRLYESGGALGVNLVLGGYDPAAGGAILFAIHPHGSVDVVEYTALGSGSFAAMGVLESCYISGMSVDQGVKLAIDAVRAGIENDLGSGSQVDVVVIGANSARYIKGVMEEEQLGLSRIDLQLEEEIHRQQLDSDGLDMDSNSCIRSGVNGFVSLPYRVKKRIVVIESKECVQRSKDKWLESLLQLNGTN